MAEKISLSGVPETMLQTVYARAKETEQRGAICDKKAVEIVKKLEKLKGKPKNKLLFLSVQIVAIHRSSFSLCAFPVYRIKLFILLYILLLKMKTAAF